MGPAQTHSRGRLGELPSKAQTPIVHPLTMHCSVRQPDNFGKPRGFFVRIPGAAEYETAEGRLHYRQRDLRAGGALLLRVGDGMYVEVFEVCVKPEGSTGHE